jgi:hypothetical protein
MLLMIKLNLKGYMVQHKLKLLKLITKDIKILKNNKEIEKKQKAHMKKIENILQQE